jgi:ABC-type antimicrobial peptide transport system permease subunit
VARSPEGRRLADGEHRPRGARRAAQPATGELGIRIALGAGRRSVEGRILGRGLRTAAAGAAVGLVGAYATGRLLETRLFGVEAGDPATLITGVAVLTTAAFACWLPARRAARADPLEVLRQE